MTVDIQVGREAQVIDGDKARNGRPGTESERSQLTPEHSESEALDTAFKLPSAKLFPVNMIRAQTHIVKNHG
jgi:hypothetical protein